MTWDIIWVCFQINTVWKLPSTKVGEYINRLVQRHFQKATDPFIPQIFTYYILRFSSNVFFQGPLCHSGKQPQTPWHQLECLIIGSFSTIYWRIILSEVCSFKKEYLKNLRFCLLHSNLAFKTNSLYSDTIIIHQLKRGIRPFVVS